MKRYSISLVTREMQIQTMMQYRHIPTRMAQMKNTENPVCEVVKHLEASQLQVEKVKIRTAAYQMESQLPVPTQV